MAGLRTSLECILMLGYAVSLALIAFLLEWFAGHAHRRSVERTTAGFTYHPDRDIWRCPQDQHLFPVFSDSARGRVIYRAPAATCNACPSKSACTDSSDGREIERRDRGELENGVKQFHQGVSLTLLVLASLILVIELFRTAGLYPRIALGSTLAVFCGVIQHLSAKFAQSIRRNPSSPSVL